MARVVWATQTPAWYVEEFDLPAIGQYYVAYGPDFRPASLLYRAGSSWQSDQLINDRPANEPRDLGTTDVNEAKRIVETMYELEVGHE